jgi:hypothetical protein
MEPDSSARIPGSVKKELDLLVDELYAIGIKADKGEIVGGLLRAAHRSPIEAVGAVIQTFIADQAAAKAAEGRDLT